MASAKRCTISGCTAVYTILTLAVWAFITAILLSEGVSHTLIWLSEYLHK